MAKYIIEDLETTGFSREWDSIIEIAGVLWDSEEDKVLDEFHELIKPSKSIPAKITEITGIDNFMVRNCRSEQEVMRDYIEWVFLSNPDAIIGHNIKTFDHGFVSTKAEKYRLKMFDIPMIDTLQIARQLTKEGKLPVLNHKQVTLAAYYGIVYEAHRAGEDIRALIQIYKKMTTLPEIKAKRNSLGF